MKKNIFLFMIILLLSITTSNADDKRLLRLIDSKQYEKAYPIIEKEIYLGDYSHAHILAQMYEGGFGVAKNSEKAIEFHKKAVMSHKKSSSAYRLGQYYYYGKNVDKIDYEKAAYWWRLGATLGSIKAMESYSLINIDDDLFHALVASKWMQYAQKKGSQKAKKFFQENPKFKDTEIYERLRAYNIDQTPFEKKLLGIVLGEKFNEELLVRTPKSKPYIRINKASYNHYKDISKEYADQDDKYFKNLKYLNVKTTLSSNTVYRIRGYYFFKSEKECEKFEKEYFMKLSRRASKVSSKIKRVKNVKYMDIDVPNNGANIDFLYGMKPKTNQKGTRHILNHYPSKNKKGFYVRVVVIDFETLKLKIAEALKSDLFFEYVGKEYPKAHDSRKHFGLTLLEKIPLNVQKKLISSSDRGKMYEIYPKYPHKFFQMYRVTTSVLTDTIVKIEARATFEDKMDSYNALEGTKIDIHDKFKLGDENCWNDNKITIDSKKGLICHKRETGKDQLSIFFDSEKYAFTFRVQSDYAKKLKNKEYWLLSY